MSNFIPLYYITYYNRVSCTIIDGQALVQAIGKPAGAKTFGDLAEAFSSAVFSHFSATCTQVDVTFDRYKKTSIKSGTRTKRACAQSKPIRRNIGNKEVPLPIKWKHFIDHPDNKADLANFLSEDLIRRAKDMLQNGELITSGGFVQETGAASSHGTDVSPLKSTHEEADTRIILHALAACQNGYDRLIICSRDTDVLVLLVHFANQLSQEIWFRAGTAQRRCFVAVHAIRLPASIQRNLPAYLPCTDWVRYCESAIKTRGKTIMVNIPGTWRPPQRPWAWHSYRSSHKAC